MFCAPASRGPRIAPIGMISASLWLSVMIFCKSPVLSMIAIEIRKGISSKSV